VQKKVRPNIVVIKIISSFAIIMADDQMTFLMMIFNDDFFDNFFDDF